jgi:hypothetical protein
MRRAWSSVWRHVSITWPPADGLDHEHLVRLCGLVVIHVVENQLGIGHLSSSVALRRPHDEVLHIHRRHESTDSTRPSFTGWRHVLVFTGRGGSDFGVGPGLARGVLALVNNFGEPKRRPANVRY